MKKLLLAFLIPFYSLLLVAQADYSYRVEVSGINNESDVKKVSFVVAYHQEGIKLSWDDTRSYFKLKCPTRISEDLLHSELINAGYLLASLTLDLSQITSIKNIPGFPLMQSTADPEMDALNYSIAKEQWVQANPDIYAYLLTPTVNDPINIESK